MQRLDDLYREHDLFDQNMLTQDLNQLLEYVLLYCVRISCSSSTSRQEDEGIERLSVVRE